MISNVPATSRDNPARSASAITGTRPAHDTRFSSSNRASARDDLCHNLAESAFRQPLDQDLSNPHLCGSEGTSTHYTPLPKTQLIGGFRLSDDYRPVAASYGSIRHLHHEPRRAP